MIKEEKELIEELNNRNIDYLIMRGLHSNDLNKDVDILLPLGEEFPQIKYYRILHFQYGEKHKGLTFVSQRALDRKVWNGEYWELCLKDKIRMKVLRNTKFIYNFVVNLFELIKSGLK